MTLFHQGFSQVAEPFNLWLRKDVMPMWRDLPYELRQAFQSLMKAWTNLRCWYSNCHVSHRVLLLDTDPSFFKVWVAPTETRLGKPDDLGDS